jgi:hypothetical protein
MFPDAGEIGPSPDGTVLAPESFTLRRMDGGVEDGRLWLRCECGGTDGARDKREEPSMTTTKAEDLTGILRSSYPGDKERKIEVQRLGLGADHLAVKTSFSGGLFDGPACGRPIDACQTPWNRVGQSGSEGPGGRLPFNPRSGQARVRRREWAARHDLPAHRGAESRGHDFGHKEGGGRKNPPPIPLILWWTILDLNQ